jgi:hypothetical protein
MRTFLIVAAVLLLAPLALHLAFGILFAGVALIITAIKLAPLLAIGLLIYWAARRQRRPHHSGRW